MLESVKDVGGMMIPTVPVTSNAWGGHRVHFVVPLVATQHQAAVNHMIHPAQLVLPSVATSPTGVYQPFVKTACALLDITA